MQGTPKYELHGGIKTGTCIDCKKKYTMEEIKILLSQNPAPRCTECGGNHLKADVVLFEESLPEGIIDKCLEQVAECDLLIVIGSSLQVAPANMLPTIAKQHGASLLLINMSETPIDSAADVVVHAPVGEILPKILQAVQSSLK